MNFTHAIVRTPGESFAQGITTSGLGAPDLKLALEQHAAYVRALESCGLQVTVLQPEPEFPDSTFVEDPAVLAGGSAILARPGADSRAGEVERIRPALEAYFERRECIQPPGTLDGGDICQAGKHFFIGISDRTNEAGAQQLATILAGLGFSAAPVDLRAVPGMLHLKSGLAALDERRLLVDERLARHPAFAGYDLLQVPPEESYAANCLPINDRLLFAAGFPRLEARLRQAGCNLLVLDVSEFRKMDGGLSCLSLRW
jgi:dimethylargininase